MGGDVIWGKERMFIGVFERMREGRQVRLSGGEKGAEKSPSKRESVVTFQGCGWLGVRTPTRAMPSQLANNGKTTVQRFALGKRWRHIRRPMGAGNLVIDAVTGNGCFTTMPPESNPTRQHSE